MWVAKAGNVQTVFKGTIQCGGKPKKKASNVSHSSRYKKDQGVANFVWTGGGRIQGVIHTRRG